MPISKDQEKIIIEESKTKVRPNLLQTWLVDRSSTANRTQSLGLEKYSYSEQDKYKEQVTQQNNIDINTKLIEAELGGEEEIEVTKFEALKLLYKKYKYKFNNMSKQSNNINIINKKTLAFLSTSDNSSANDLNDNNLQNENHLNQQILANQNSQLFNLIEPKSIPTQDNVSWVQKVTNKSSNNKQEITKMTKKSKINSPKKPNAKINLDNQIQSSLDDQPAVSNSNKTINIGNHQESSLRIQNVYSNEQQQAITTNNSFDDSSFGIKIHACTEQQSRNDLTQAAQIQPSESLLLLDEDSNNEEISKKTIASNYQHNKITPLINEGIDISELSSQLEPEQQPPFNSCTIEGLLSYAHFSQNKATSIDELNKATQELSKGIDELITTKKLNNLVAEKNNNFWKYSSLEIQFSNDNKELIINVDLNFTGVIRINRLNKDNTINQESVDIIYYKNGKIIDLVMAAPIPNKDNCRIYQLAQAFYQNKNIDLDIQNNLAMHEHQIYCRTDLISSIKTADNHTQNLSQRIMQSPNQANNYSK